MSSPEPPTQIGKIIGSAAGLVLFFLAPFLLDLGFAFFIALPLRRQALSSSRGDFQNPIGYHPIIQYLILAVFLSLLTLAGFAIWKYFWKQLEKTEVSRTYLYSIIVFGSLTLIVNLIWLGSKLMVGLWSISSSSTGLFTSLDFPFPLNILLLFLLILEVGAYSFGHPVLVILMLHHHWDLTKG